MGWPESVTFLLLVVLGYALTRIVDLVIDWQRRRLGIAHASQSDGQPQLSATARQRLLERRAVYARFRKTVSDTVDVAVGQGHGNYGMLYQIRDAYGDLLRTAPSGIAQAADSVIRCVTLLVNLGQSDQRYAMFTRALKLYDDECELDQGVRPLPQGPAHREFSVLGSNPTMAVFSELPETRRQAAGGTTAPAAPQTGSDSASAHVPR